MIKFISIWFIDNGGGEAWRWDLRDWIERNSAQSLKLLIIISANTINLYLNYLLFHKECVYVSMWVRERINQKWKSLRITEADDWKGGMVVEKIQGRNFIYFNAQQKLKLNDWSRQRSFRVLNPLLTFCSTSSRSLTSSSKKKRKETKRKKKNAKRAEIVWCETLRVERGFSTWRKYLLRLYFESGGDEEMRNIIHNNNCNHAKLLKEFVSLFRFEKFISCA